MTAAVRSEIFTGGILQTSRLSPLHSLLLTLERELAPTRWNELWNDPSILPYISASTTPLDWSAPIKNRANVFLHGDHGGMAFVQASGNIFEAHLGVLPSGRGAWCRLFVQACTHWMFARSTAVEIFAYCPLSNPFVERLAVSVGWTYELTRPDGWTTSRGVVPARVYRLGLLDWTRLAPGLVERGRWFIDKLRREYRRHGVKIGPIRMDEEHARNFGALCELIFGGNVQAAVALFSRRFAVFSGMPTIELLEVNPVVVIKMRDAVLFFRDEDFYIHSLDQKHGDH